jgi:hypothetical protein
LEILNHALAILFEQLRDAKALFESSRNSGRARSLRCVPYGCFLRDFAQHGKGFTSPLLDLASALMALNANNVVPLLKPSPRSGRAYDSPMRQALVGFAAGAVE